MSYVINALLTIIDFVIGAYLLVVMLRFILQMVRADIGNPISQTVLKLTQPPLKFLRRFIPGYGGIDWPSIVLLFSIQALEITVITVLVTGTFPNILGLLVLCLAKLLKLLIYVYLFMIFITVIISWINPGAYNPMTALIHQVITPLMRPIRDKIPPSAGIDFSPMVAMLLLYLALMLIVAPLMDTGYRLSGIGLRLF